MSAPNIDILEKHVKKVRATLKKGLIALSVWDVENGLDIVSYNAKPRTSAKLNLFTQAMQEQLADIGLRPLSRYYIMDLQEDNMAVVILHGGLMEGWLIDSSQVKMGALFSIAIPDALEDVRLACESSDGLMVDAPAPEAVEPAKPVSQEVSAQPSEAPQFSARPKKVKAVKPEPSAEATKPAVQADAVEKSETPQVDTKPEAVKVLQPEPAGNKSADKPTEKAISDEAIARLISESESAEEATKAVDKKIADKVETEASKDGSEAKPAAKSVVATPAQLEATEDYLEEFFDDSGESDTLTIIPDVEKQDSEDQSVAPKDVSEKTSEAIEVESTEEPLAPPPKRDGPTILELDPAPSKPSADEVGEQKEAETAVLADEDLEVAIADSDDAIEQVSKELDIDFGGDEDVVLTTDSSPVEASGQAASEPEAAKKPAPTEPAKQISNEPQAAKEKPAAAPDDASGLVFEGKYFKLTKWPNVSDYEDRNNLAAMNSKLMRKHYDLPSILKWGVSEQDVKSVLTKLYHEGGLDIADENPKASSKAPPKKAVVAAPAESASESKSEPKPEPVVAKAPAPTPAPEKKAEPQETDLDNAIATEEPVMMIIDEDD